MAQARQHSEQEGHEVRKAGIPTATADGQIRDMPVAFCGGAPVLLTTRIPQLEGRDRPDAPPPAALALLDALWAAIQA